MALAQTADSMGATKVRKRRSAPLTRDAVIRRLNGRLEDRKPSPLVVLKEVFEETKDKGRFVGDTMFWKYFEDIDLSRIHHTNSVEYRNLQLMFWETVFYLVMLLLLTVYAYAMQSNDVYSARQQQVNYWSGCDARGSCRIKMVDDVSSFWGWMQTEFVPLAFTDQGGAPPVAVISPGFPGNRFPVAWSPRYVGPQRSSVVLGSVRVRQLRVQKNQGCEVSKLFSHIFPDCYGHYNAGYQSRRTYAPRFMPTYLSGAFRWQSEEDTDQVMIRGTMNDYGGSGFTVDLPDNDTEAATMLSDLRRWHWVDRATRAIVVELTTLNTNVDVLVNTRILFEFGPTGSTVGSVVSGAAFIFLLAPSTSSGTAVLVFMLQLAIFLVFLAYTGLTLWLMYKTCQNFLGERPITKMRKSGVMKSISFLLHTLYHYLRYGWNLVDLVLLVLFYAHMGLRIQTYVAKGNEAALAPDTIGHPQLFMPCSKLLEPLSSGNNVLAVLVLFAWAKLFKYLCMSSYFRLLVRILERCAARLGVFSVLLVVIFFGFAVSFYVGFGGSDEAFSTISGSFLMLFFLLLDGYVVDERWFDPGQALMLPVIYFCYIAIIYFVLLNIFLAVVLDVYATYNHGVRSDALQKDNPMAVFLYTYVNWMRGISLVLDDTDPNLKKEDLSIRLELLPGIVRRKWIEKKRKMQRVASENFEGMDLFPEDVQTCGGGTVVDWMLPSTRTDVMDKIRGPGAEQPLAVYDVPRSMLKDEVSRDQLQRLMDEDGTLPLLLGSKRAVDVIRKFRDRAPAGDDEDDEKAEPLKALQGYVFGKIDDLEKVRLDEEVPNTPEIAELTEEMSSALTSLRNQFRQELTTIIEATGTLFKHLVELAQAMNAVRDNNQDVVGVMRQRFGAAPAPQS